jgi:hypothetical protein
VSTASKIWASVIELVDTPRFFASFSRALRFWDELRAMVGSLLVGVFTVLSVK